MDFHTKTDIQSERERETGCWNGQTYCRSRLLFGHPPLVEYEGERWYRVWQWSKLMQRNGNAGMESDLGVETNISLGRRWYQIANTVKNAGMFNHIARRFIPIPSFSSMKIVWSSYPWHGMNLIASDSQKNTSTDCEIYQKDEKREEENEENDKIEKWIGRKLYVSQSLYHKRYHSQDFFSTYYVETSPPRSSNRFLMLKKGKLYEVEESADLLS